MELSMKDFYTFNSKGYLTTVSVFPDLCEPLMGDAAFNLRMKPNMKIFEINSSKLIYQRFSS